MKSNFKKILRELSYRVSSGIPDLTNEQHLMKLWDILKEEKWPVEVRVELLKNLQEVDQALLRTKITNPTTKRKIQVRTGLGYKKTNTAAYNVAKSFLKDKGVSDDEIEKQAQKSAEDDVAKSKSNVDKEREKIGGEVYTEPLEITDEEFNKKNKENQITEPFVMPDVVKNNPKIPKKYTQFIERVMNTNKNIKDNNQKAGYYGIGKAGAGDTDSNAGELMSMMATTMNSNDRVEFFKAIDKTIERASINGEKLYITPAWSRAAKENSSAILRMMYDKYGKDYEIVGSAWDIEEEFKALGQNYDEKGYSTDIMFTVKSEGKVMKEEVSLKQKLKNQRLWNGMVSSAFDDDVLPKELSQGGESKYKEGQIKNIEDFYQNNKTNISEFLGGVSDLEDYEKTLEKVAKSMDKKERNQQLIVEGFSNFVSQYKKDLSENPNLNLSRDYIKQNLKSQNVKADKRAMDKLSMTLGLMMDDYGDTEAGNFVKEQKVIAKEQAKKIASYINESEEAKQSVLKKVQEKLPLKSVSDGDESIILGEYVINKKTLEGIFGTDDWNKVVEKLSVNPDADPPSIEYKGQVRGKERVVPITTIGIREDGEGYGGAHKFEMLVAEDFGNYVESVSKDIFGEQEPIIFPGSTATLRKKEK